MIASADRLIKPIFFEANDVVYDWTYEKMYRFQTAVEVTQKYIGLEMQRYGYGYKTFTVEADSQNGRPKIHYYRGQYDTAHYGLDRISLDTGYDSMYIWGQLTEELRLAFNPDGQSILLVICKNCPWLGLGSYEGGGIGMIGDYLYTDFGRTYDEQMEIFCDQTQPHEENAPGWEEATRAELASGRVGGFVHELGHALGSIEHSPDTSLMGSGGHFAFARYFVGNECLNSDLHPAQVGTFTAPIFNGSPFLSPLSSQKVNAPVQFTAFPVSPTKMHLLWVDTANNETNFKLARSGVSGGPFMNFPSLNVNTAAYRDTATLTASTTYFYKLFAYISSGGQSSPTYVSAQTLPLPPQPPLNFIVSSNTRTQINLKWDPVPGATYYKIEMKLSSDSAYTLFPSNITAISFPVLNLKRNTSYDFNLYAYNSGGASVPAKLTASTRR